MSDTALLDPPAPQAAEGNLADILAKEMPSHGQPQPVKQEVIKTDLTPLTPEVAKDTPGAVSEPKKGAPETKPGKKAKWDSMEPVKKAEEIKVEAKKEEKPEAKPLSQTEGQLQEGSPQKIRWDELRATEDRMKTLLPEHEALKAKFEKLEADYKAKSVDDDERAQLNSYKQLYAEEELESGNADYQREVVAPAKIQNERILSAAASAGLDEVQTQALRSAINLIDPLQRLKAIRNVISQGRIDKDGESVPLPDEDVRDAVALAKDAASELHDNIFQKDKEYRLDARNKANDARGSKARETAEAKKREEVEYQAANEDMKGRLSAQLPLLFEDKDTRIEGQTLAEAIAEARPATDPMGRAYEAHAGVSLPYMATLLNRTLKERDEARASLKARVRSAPGAGDGLAPPAEKTGSEISLNEAIRNDFRGGP